MRPQPNFQQMPVMRMQQVPRTRMLFQRAPGQPPISAQAAFHPGTPPKLEKLFQDTMGAIPHIVKSRVSGARPPVDVDKLSDELVQSAHMKVNPTSDGLSVEFAIPEDAIEHLRQRIREGMVDLSPEPQKGTDALRMMGMRPRFAHGADESGGDDGDEEEKAAQIEARAGVKQATDFFSGLMSSLEDAGDPSETPEHSGQDDNPLAKLLGDASHFAESILGGINAQDPPESLPGAPSQLEDLLSDMRLAPEDGALGPWMRNQTTKAMYLEIPVHGMNPKAIQVHLRENRLIVTAEQDKSVTSKHGAEESSSMQDLHEEFALPYPVHDQVRAFVKKGKLVVQLPPPEVSGPELDMATTDLVDDELAAVEELNTESAEQEQKPEPESAEQEQKPEPEPESAEPMAIEGDDDDMEASKDSENDEYDKDTENDKTDAASAIVARSSNDADREGDDSSSSEGDDSSSATTTHFYASDSLPVRR